MAKPPLSRILAALLLLGGGGAAAVLGGIAALNELMAQAFPRGGADAGAGNELADAPALL